MQSGKSVFSIEKPKCLFWKFSFFASAAQVVVSPILMRWSLFDTFKFHMCTPLDHSEDDGNTTIRLEYTNLWILSMPLNCSFCLIDSASRSETHQLSLCHIVLWRSGYLVTINLAHMMMMMLLENSILGRICWCD